MDRICRSEDCSASPERNQGGIGAGLERNHVPSRAVLERFGVVGVQLFWWTRETACRRTLPQLSIGSAPQNRQATGQAADGSARSLARLIGFPYMDELRERLLQQGLVRVAMAEVLAEALRIGKPTFASKTRRPRRHSIQILVKPVIGTKPFPLRGVAG